MEDKIATRVREMRFSGIRKFFELVQKAEDIISLGVGEPDFPTPEPIKDAAIRAIENDFTSYTSNYGILELREIIAEKLKKENSLNYDPEKEIIITTGVSEALDLAIRAILNPGEDILIFEPCYVSYRANVFLSHGNPIPVPTYEEDGFKPIPEEIEKRVTKRTKAIIICSPNNPTGTVLNKKDLENIADIAIEHDLIVISDEIYEKLIYDGEKHHSIGSLNGMRDRVITLNGFSKVFSMTGWRLGYAASNEKIIEAMMKIHQYSMLCAPTISQYAALEAFKAEKYVKKMIETYDMRRKLLVKGLNSISGITCVMPKGAFYAFPSIKNLGMSSEEFATLLLKEAKVAVVPGSAFGECGEGYIRCSYSVSREDISEALARIENFVEKVINDARKI